MRKSISVAFFSVVTTLMIAVVCVMGLSQMLLFCRYYANDRYTDMNDIAEVAENALTYYMACADTMSAEQREDLIAHVNLIQESAHVSILVADEEGKVVLTTDEVMATGDPVSAELLEKIRRRYDERGTCYNVLSRLGGALSERCFVAARPVYDAAGGVYATLFICASGSLLGVVAGQMFSNFLMSVCIGVLCVSLMGVALMRRFTEPLHKISEAAQKFGGGDFSVRVDVAGDDEIAALAHTFNNMAANLQAIDNSRAQFMGNIAHELRTPMTTIKGFVDGILDGTIPQDQQKHYLQLVSQEASRLARLIQNMLDLSKLESGEYRVNARMFNVWETITGAALSAEQRINDGMIEMEGLTLDRFNVYADPDLVHQVVYNLLDNAIKFTPPGGIIRFAVEKRGPEAEISIWNSGQGISEEALPFVFERFYKEDPSRGLHARGAGLGLNICKVLVNLSGGQIRVESKQGEWCRFVFTLPTEVPNPGDIRRLPDETGGSGAARSRKK